MNNSCKRSEQAENRPGGVGTNFNYARICLFLMLLTAFVPLTAQIKNPFKEAKDSIANVLAAQKAQFEAKKASRPSVPPPHIAEAKPNEPVKKESFTAMLARIKADGNKAGILFMSSGVYIRPPEPTAIRPANYIRKFYPKDTIDAPPQLESLAQSLADQLNAGFDTDIFEVIQDINEIPYRQMGGFLIDDWWATKYKMVLIYDINDYYSLDDNEEEFSGYFRVNSRFVAYQYFLKKDKPRSNILGQPSLGNYAKRLTNAPMDEIKSIEDIQQKMNGKINVEEVIETLNKERKSKLDKFIAKKTKK